MKYLVIILRFIKGYVVFKAEKGFTERFINLCTQNRLILWDVSIENNILTASVSIRNFKKLRTIVKKSGVKITIIRKIGLIFQYRQYHKRVGIAVGILIFAAFHLIMSQFVWCIDVTGNKTFSKEEIIERAEGSGITYGTYKKNFNEVKAAREIASQYEGEIPWLSINIKGSMAIIELRENNKIISELEDNTPCNLIADFDGVILSVEAFRGDAEVNVGSGVKKGDMLINGVIINEDLSTSYYKAKGKITALRSKTVKISKKADKPCFKITASEVFYTIGFLGIEIPFGRLNDNKDSIFLTDKRHIEINGYKLPFYIIKNTVVRCYDKNVAQYNAYIDLSENISFGNYTDNRNSTIISKAEKFSKKSGTYVFSGEYTLIDFMGEEKPILSDKTK